MGGSQQSQDKFHIICVYIRSPIDLCKGFCYDFCITDHVSTELFNLIDLQRIVVDAERKEPGLPFETVP